MGLFRRTKANNKPLLRQIIDLVPPWLLNSCIKHYQSDKGCSKYKAYDQFVARIKSNTVYESIRELDLPDCTDQDILKDEIIRLSSTQAKKKGLGQQKPRLVSVYKEDKNKVIHIITNQLDWQARTIAQTFIKNDGT